MASYTSPASKQAGNQTAVDKGRFQVQVMRSLTQVPTADSRTDAEIYTLSCAMKDLIKSTCDTQRRLDNVESWMSSSTGNCEGLSKSCLSQFKAEIKAEVLEEVRCEFKLTSEKMCAPEVKVELCASEAKPEASFDEVNTNEMAAQELPLSYTFEESVWDLGIFLGHERIGFSGSVLVGLQLVLLVGMQIAFCIVCQLNFTDNAFDESAREGLQDFRLRYAHDTNFKDPASGVTLASAICAGSVDSTFKLNQLMYGNSQAQTLDTIRSYLGEDEDSGFVTMFGGRTLCALALGCWILVVFKHIRMVCRCFFAVISVPKGKESEICMQGEALTLKSISRGRLCILFFITVVRIGCYSLLLYSGSAWLAYTTDAKDLVLNAAALEFVLDLDALLFASLTPIVGKAFLERMDPIQETQWICCKGLDLASSCGWFSVLILLPSFFFSMVHQLAIDMRNAEAILCDGNVNVEYSADSYINMIWFHEGGFADNEVAKSFQSLILSSIQTKVAGTTLEPELGNYANRPPFDKIDISRVSTMDTNSFVNALNPWCSDTVYEAGTFKKLVEVVQNRRFQSCSEMANWCMNPEIATSVEWNVLRTLCPESCGCANPRSIVPDYRSSFGCPRACLASDAYLNALRSENCSDTSVDVLRSSDFWPSWAKHIGSYLSLGSELSTEQVMLRDGCSVLHALPKSDIKEICEGTSTQLPLRPLSPICPETCACATGVIGACAPACTPLFG